MISGNLPGYKYLLTYRYAEVLHDLTVEFCCLYLSDLSNLSNPGNLSKIPTRRTIEQMTQAARPKGHLLARKVYILASQERAYGVKKDFACPPKIAPRAVYE